MSSEQDQMTDDLWAKAIIMHLTGTADDPTPMLLVMIAEIRNRPRPLTPITNTPPSPNTTSARSV